MLNLLFVVFVLKGIPSSCMFAVSLPILPYYFKEKRIIANAVVMSASISGQFILSPLWVYFCNTFTIHGAFILLAGWYLQIIICGAILRPIQFFTARNQTCRTIDNAITCESTKSCHCVGEANRENINTTPNKFTFELSLFKNPYFTLFVISSMFSIFCFRSVTLGIPPYLREKRFSLTSISYILSINALSDLFGRIILGFILNLKFVKNYITVSGFYCFVQFVTGSTICLMSFCESATAVCILSVILGFIGGETIGLVTPVLLDLIDAEKLGNGIGYMSPVYFLGIAISPLLLGKTRTILCFEDIFYRTYKFLSVCNTVWTELTGF